MRTDLRAYEGVVNDGALGLEFVVQLNGLGFLGEAVIEGGSVFAVQGQNGDLCDLVGLNPVPAAFGHNLDRGFGDVQRFGEFDLRSLLVSVFRQLH
ncbi:hypothetical protein [Arthrobacter sp. ISL-28]|uniref:hypothetical protein n=1 Tax=Arthrobacter sp. ISL-28 TaxID=2819108 RepID=UPI0037C0E3EC